MIESGELPGEKEDVITSEVPLHGGGVHMDFGRNEGGRSMTTLERYALAALGLGALGYITGCSGRLVDADSAGDETALGALAWAETAEEDEEEDSDDSDDSEGSRRARGNTMNVNISVNVDSHGDADADAAADADADADADAAAPESRKPEGRRPHRRPHHRPPAGEHERPSGDEASGDEASGDEASGDEEQTKPPSSAAQHDEGASGG